MTRSATILIALEHCKLSLPELVSRLDAAGLESVARVVSERLREVEGNARKVREGLEVE